MTDAYDAQEDQWVDEWSPEGLEWEHLVREYPLPALAAAAAFGFWLGRHHGRQILTAFAAYAGRQLGEFVDREVHTGAGKSGRG